MASYVSAESQTLILMTIQQALLTSEPPLYPGEMFSNPQGNTERDREATTSGLQQLSLELSILMAPVVCLSRNTLKSLWSPSWACVVWPLKTQHIPGRLSRSDGCREVWLKHLHLEARPSQSMLDESGLY